MNAFLQACSVESQSLKDLLPFVRKYSPNLIQTDKGRLSREFQKQYGDAIANSERDGILAIEFKTERENKYGNLFLETWSNRKWYTRGWMDTLNADILLYYFLKTRQVFVIKFPVLREWAFHRNRIYDFAEKEQGQYDQKNDTWGRCVPIETLKREIGMREYRFTGENDSEIDWEEFTAQQDDPGYRQD